MNSAVLIKIEAKLPGEPGFTLLDIIPHSGTLKEEPQKTNAGIRMVCVVDFKIARSSEEADTLLKKLLDRKTEYRITDANNVVYRVGSPSEPAKLSYNRILDGAPGSMNGYLCTITHQSRNGCIVS